MSNKKAETDFFDFNIRYDKEKDKHNTINTESVLEKRNKQLHQFYTGLYYQKCYHNTGRYKWINGDEEYVYEGKLYANDLHGYGRLVYPDNSTYEGLFSHNKRFGPGVVTYPDGQQDVGLWNGKYLIRLSQNIDLADFYLENIPTIAKTLEGKLSLVKFKKIVPLLENDPVANLIKKLGMKAEDGEKLYSKCIRNNKSIFMNRSVFDKNFYTDPKELIVDVVDHFDENEEPVISKITATNLLAWSNEKTYISIMKHAFMNRKYEKIISYKIRNAFIPNRRDTFMAEGPIEEMCLKLLAACRNDDTVNISKLISDYDLFPDVSDCFGNSTIMYAAMANKRNAIKTLVNLGANVNVINDECVSALILCILHYIAIKNEILEENWETSFLKLPDDANMMIDGRMWPTGSSSSSFDSEVVKVESNSTKSSTSTATKSKKQRKQSKKNKQLKDKLKLYIFNRMYKAPKKETLSRRVINLRRKLRLSKIYRRTMKIDKNEAMTTIMKTIQTLIKCGADVNGCDVPYPPLIAALFSDNAEMVQLILESNVDVNKKTRRESGSLNPLHIVCAMDKTKNQEVIMDMLLKHGVDTNARTDKSHWPEAQQKILAGDPFPYMDEENGKTPFHVLAMRYDFDEDEENRIVKMAEMLVENGADANAQYLGHNPLSLAALHGNVTLMDHILRNSLCDPNACLGYNMGVPLTMLTLRKYSKLLMPTTKLETIMETLVKHNANPFNEISEFEGNALEFAVTSNNQTFFGSKENIGLNILQNLSASILRRYIDSRALQVIFNTQIRQQQNNPYIGLIAKYLNFEKAHKIVQILLDNFRIPPNFELCMKLLNYIYARFGKGKLQVNLIEKPGIRTSFAGTGRSTKRNKPTEFEMTKTLVQIKMKRKIYELDFNREDKDDLVTPFKENMPELDTDHEKYKVCYGCLERSNKKLQLCPYCNLIYFCSEKCNILKNESGEHPCKKVFYVSSNESVIKSKGEKRRRTKKSTLRGSLYYDTLKDGIDSDMDDDDDDDADDDYSLSMDESDSDSKRRRKRKKHGRRRRRRRRRVSKRIRFRKRRIWYRPEPHISKKYGKKVCTATCKGKLISIGFREPFSVVERKMRRKYQPPEVKYLRREVWSNKLKCKFPLNENNIDLMLRVARRVNLQLVPITDPDDLLNPCDPFDYKFWQLFLPYCVFQNGELFYRSNDCDLLYKLPYKYN